MKFWIALCLAAATATAHDTGMSTASVEFRSHDLLVQMTFARADLVPHQGQSWKELAPRVAQIFAAGALVTPRSVEVRETAKSDVEFILHFPRPAADVTLRSPLLARLPFGHRQVLVVRDASGTPIGTRLLSGNFASIELEAAEPRAKSAQAGAKAWPWVVVASLAILTTAVVGIRFAAVRRLRVAEA